MKRIICLIVTAALLFTSTTSIAYAKSNNEGKNNRHEVTNQEKQKIKEKKQEFKIDGSPVIKYERFQLPINPIKKGMGANVTFDKSTAVLTVEKGTIKIVIDFKNKTVTVNGVPDTTSGIFTSSNSKKKVVLIQYIAKILGIKVEVDDDEIEVVVPGLDLPTNIVITTLGDVNKANTLNLTTKSMSVAANIKAGQATAGKAELYVGSKLVATDSVITAYDASVNFNVQGNTLTNEELRALVPAGGVVTVKLYNANNQAVRSAVGNPTLVVDYIAPTITGITSATFNAAGGRLNLNVTGAGAVGDLVDVTKITLYDPNLVKYYTLTNASGTGSYGVVKSANSLQIDLGSADRIGLSGFGSTIMNLTVAPGSFLTDVAGNTSPVFASTLTVPVTTSAAVLDLPTNISITPVGGTVLPNTLNTTTLYLTATAKITAGQATGGKAELYVGNKLVATDYSIEATDMAVTFSTYDGTPSNAELQASVPGGGVVTVKLYNAYSYSVISAVGNPTLIVDYTAPTITGITSGLYLTAGSQLYITVTGAGAIGDIVDVTKIALYDNYGRIYHLTNNTGTGSSGYVLSPTSLVISLGAADKNGIKDFGANVNLLVTPDALIKDAAGNTSASFAVGTTIPVTIIK